jgi:D-alanyl-D-alanine carboxypeptidase
MPGQFAVRATLLAYALFASLNAAPAFAGLAAVDRQLETALDEVIAAPTGPPGASALIQRGDRISFHRAGTADLRTGRAIHRTDHMRIASTAKAFSGAVSLSHVDQGRLELDGTLGELLPGSPAAWSEVTLAQLLNHTGGVPDYTRSAEFAQQLRSDPGGYVSPSQVVSWVADEPLTFEPGTSYTYSNTDNILVGLIVEAETGRAYGNELRQRVYRPVGLRQTSLPSTTALPLRFVHGYGLDPPGREELSTLINPSGAWASGGIVSTPADLNRFVRAYAGGSLFGRGVRDRQHRFVAGNSDPPGPGENGAGLAIFRYRTDCGTVFGHTGSFPGYTQFMAATGNGRRSVVVSANQQISPEANPDAYEVLRPAFEAGVCAARATRHN